MRTLLFIIISAVLIGHAWAAFIITCPSENITAINQTNRYGNQIFDTNYFDNLFSNSTTNVTDCVINTVPDNQVYFGNAITN